MLLMMFDRDIEYVREKMRERERDVCFWIQSRKRKYVNKQVMAFKTLKFRFGNKLFGNK